MKRRLPAYLIPCLLFVLVGGQGAQAATTAGSPCKKVNATSKANGQNFKCVKSGKKLVWRIVAPTKNPTPITTPTPTPRNSKLNLVCSKYMTVDPTENLICQYKGFRLTWLRRALPLTASAASAFDAVQATKRSAAEGLEKLVIYQSPTFSPSRAETLTTNILSAMANWRAQYWPGRPLPVIFMTEKDREWYEITLRKLSVPEELVTWAISFFDSQVSAGGSGVANAGSGLGTKTLSFRLNFYLFGSDAIDFIGFGSSAAHEWTHNAQNAIAGELPCWFREGSAFYYGIALSSKDVEEFIEFRREAHWLNTNFDIASPPSGGWGPWLDKRLLNYDNTKCGPDGSYVVGSLMTEYLLSLKGHTGIVDFMTATKTMPWDQALLQTYGMTWAQLKEIVPTYLSKEAEAFGRRLP